MSISREQLQALLVALEMGVPAMRAQFPENADYCPAFAERADDILDQARTDDEAWALKEIQRIQDQFGYCESAYHRAKHRV
jgi:hypothetical protein